MFEAISDNTWVGVLIVLGASAGAYILVRYLIFPIVYRFAHRTENTWDDVLLDRPVLLRAMMRPSRIARAEAQGRSSTPV